MGRCTMCACSGARSARYSLKARRVTRATLQTGTLPGSLRLHFLIKSKILKFKYSFKNSLRVLGLDGRLKSKKEIEGLNKVAKKS